MAILFEEVSLIQARLSLYHNHEWTEFICANKEPGTEPYNQMLLPFILIYQRLFFYHWTNFKTHFYDGMNKKIAIHYPR